MAEELERLIIRLEADTERLARSLRKSDGLVKKSVNRQKVMLKGLKTSWTRVSRAAGALGVVLGAGAAAAGIRRIAQEADTLRNSARKIGLTTTSLQELRFAAAEAGIGTRTADMAMQRFSRRVGEVANGTGELKGIMDQYGISVLNADGTTRNLEDVLADLSDAAMNAGSSQEQLRIAFKAFDSEGAQFVNVLREGSALMQELRDKAHELNQVIGEDSVNALADANREIEIYLKSWEVGFTEFFGAIAQRRNQNAIVGGDMLPRTTEQADRALASLEALREIAQAELNVSFFDSDEKEELARVLEIIKKVTAAREALVVAGQIDEERNKNQGATIDADAEIARAKSAAAILDGVKSQTEGVISSILRLQGVKESEITLSLLSLNIENGLRRTGIELTDIERANLNAELRLLEDKINKNEQLTEAQEKSKKKIEETNRATEQWNRTLQQGLSDMIFRATSLSDVLDGVLKRLAQAALFGNDGNGGLFGGLLNSASSAIGSTFSLPGLATGGGMNAGVPYLVGERGPELVIPKGGGTVANAHNTRGMLGGGVTFNQHLTFTSDTRETMREEIMNAAPKLQAATLQVMAKSQAGRR